MHIDTPVKRLAPTPAAALVHEAALRAAYLTGMAARRSAAAQHDATTPAATAAEQTQGSDASTNRCGAAEADTMAITPGPRQKKPSSKQSHSRHARRDATKAARAAALHDSGRQ